MTHRSPWLEECNRQSAERELIELAGGAAAMLRDVVVIVVALALAVAASGCTPPLPPNPDPPEPDPPRPTPVVVGDWYIVVEESADRRGQAWPAVRVLLESGKNFRVYDDDSPDAAGYLDSVSGIKRPALLILDENGKKLDARPLPQSAAEMQALIGGGS